MLEQRWEPVAGRILAWIEELAAADGAAQTA